MTEQMRAVALEESVSGYHIDGQPYDFDDGQVVVVPRDVAHRFIRYGWGHYEGDVYEVDDEEYRDAIGVRDDADEPALDPTELTVGELKDAVEDADEAAVDRALEIEKENDDRKTAIDILQDA